MEFNNRPNQHIWIDKDGEPSQSIWISRSVAVLVIPFFYCNGRTWVPLGKRSATCPTEVGKYGLPCGYLDWDESATEAAIREVWEELGLNLLSFGDTFIGNLEQPYYVSSDPKGDASQNVTLRFSAAFEVESLPNLNPSAEVEEARWFLFEDTLNMDLAFNHAEILEDFEDTY